MSEIIQKPSYKAILNRIEAISRELEELRQLVLVASSVSSQNDFTNELLGSLGAESIETYEFDLDWERFGS